MLLAEEWTKAEDARSSSILHLIFKLSVFLELTNTDPFAAWFEVHRTGYAWCGWLLEPLAPFPWWRFEDSSLAWVFLAEEWTKAEDARSS